MNYTETFVRNGHYGNSICRISGVVFGEGVEPKRDTEGRIVCKRCNASMGTEQAARICPAAEFIGYDIHKREVQTLIDTFGNAKTGKKIRKKVNQMYGRQVNDLAMQAKQELDREVERRLEKFNGMVREKPRFVPTIVWRMLLHMTLKSDTMV